MPEKIKLQIDLSPIEDGFFYVEINGVGHPISIDTFLALIDESAKNPLIDHIIRNLAIRLSLEGFDGNVHALPEKVKNMEFWV